MGRVPSSDLAAFGTIMLPSEADEPILAKPVRSALLEWLEEIWCADDLKAVGLKPRSRAIFHGAPGTGKTTLAHHLAARLGLPMLKVTSDRFKTAYVSESARNIGQLFRLLRDLDEPVLVFFDEFDSLAAKRMNSGHNPTAEQSHNETINTILSGLDDWAGFCVAATNFADRVDEAIWRRFEIQIELKVPGDHERRRILERYFAPFVLPDESLAALSASLETASPALMRSFAENIKRQVVVGPKAGWSMDKADVIGRVLASVKPHPDLGLPALWSRGLEDRALPMFPWPLERSLAAYPAAPKVADGRENSSVVPLRRKGGGE